MALPKVIKIITTLIASLNKSKQKLDSDRNKRKIVRLPNKLPKTILLQEVVSFNTSFVVYKIKKSKKKLMKKTKSKYTFIPITTISIKKRND